MTRVLSVLGVRSKVACYGITGLAVTLGLLILGAAAAFGYWMTTDSSNSAVAIAGSVGAGQQPSATTISGRDVTLSWASATNAATYSVARSNVSPQSLSTTEHGSCASAVSGTSCTDTAVPENGSVATNWKYTDTPQLHNWTGSTSSLSATVTVPAPTLSLGGTSFTADGGSTSATVSNFFDTEGVTFCVDQSSSCHLGNTLGSATVPSSGGSVTASSITIPTGLSVGSHTVYAIGSLGSTPSESINVTPGAATKLAFTPLVPGPGTAGSSISNVSVSVEDQFGNVETSLNSGSVVMSIKAGSPQPTFTSGTTTVSVSSGVASFINLVVHNSGSYTFTATPSSISGVTNAVDSNAFTVNAQAAVTSLAINTISSPQTAGSGFTVTATAKDQFGNTANNSADSVALSIVAGSPQTTFSTTGSPTTLTTTLSSGTATFSGVTFNTTGSYTLSAKDTTANVTSPNSNSVTVNPAGASKLVFTTSAQTLTAGVTSATMTVQRQDSFGNPTTTGSTQVDLTTPSAGGVFRDTGDANTITSVTITASSSSASFKYKDTVATSPGTVTITAADHAAVLNSATQAETVNPAATTPNGLSVSDKSTTTPDQVLGTSSANTSIKITQTQGDNVGATYNGASNSTGSFTINVEAWNGGGGSGNHRTFTYSVVAIDAFGNSTPAATITYTDVH